MPNVVVIGGLFAVRGDARNAEQRQRLKAAAERLVSRINPCGQPSIDRRELRSQGLFQPRCIDHHAERLGGQADEGHTQALHAGMAEEEEAHLRRDFTAAIGEDLAPAMGADAGPQRHVGAGDDEAAFVELRQRIAQTAAIPATERAALGHRAVVLAVERCLSLRIGQPDQRIEGVVPVVGAGLDLAMQPGTLLVGQCRTAGGNEAQRLAVARRDAMRSDQFVQRKTRHRRYAAQHLPRHDRRERGQQVKHRGRAPAGRARSQSRRSLAHFHACNRQATVSPARNGTSASLSG
nr:hypothetical protein [Sulfurisoma sediminicola]